MGRRECMAPLDPARTSIMSTASAPPRPETVVHRALASPVRARLLERLRAVPESVDVHTLAARLGLHVNTVRGHLLVLEEAGLVTAEPQPRVGPGRPRLGYRATPAAAGGGSADSGYRVLAGVLASWLAVTVPDAADAAEHAGAAWGHHLAERPPSGQALAAGAAVDRLVVLLDDVGFAPELETDLSAGARVLLHRCPFLDLAREHGDVVCSVHRGLMRGALGELGSSVVVRDLVPFAEPDLCIVDLDVTP